MSTHRHTAGGGWQVALLCILLAGGLAMAQGAPLGASVRSGPADYVGGQTITVTNDLVPLAQVGLYSLTENVPAQWVVNAVSDGGTYDSGARTIRWLFLDNLVRRVTFQLTAPLSPTGAANFSGTAIFDTNTVAVSGMSSLPLRPPPSGRAIRHLPAQYRPGQTNSVAVDVQPEATIALYGIEERVPAGWLVVDTGGGTITSPAVIKWGPYGDATPRTLAYTVVAPSTAASNAVFSGTGWFDATTIPIDGDTSLAPAPSSGGLVTRTIPVDYFSGQLISVGLLVQPLAGTTLHAVEESVPDGWITTNISHFGTLSGGGTTIRWGPFADDTVRSLTYELISPPTAETNVVFQGSGVFDIVTNATVGDLSLPWHQPPIGTAVRTLPAQCQPGQAIWVTNVVTPASGVTAWALDEFLPTDWTVLDTGGGTYLAGSRSVRWGPFFSTDAMVLAWKVVAPTNAAGLVAFVGAAWFENEVIPVSGNSNVVIVPPSSGVTWRSVPSYYQPGLPFAVTNRIEPQPGVGLYALEENVPDGWSATNVSHGGSFLPALGLVRWGPWADDLTRTVTYRLVPPLSARGSVALSGVGYFDASQTSIQGTTNITANSPPTLSPGSDQVLRSDRLATMVFAVNDDETPASNMVFSVTSTNAGLLPNNSLALTLSGSLLRLTLSPQPNREGRTYITVSVSDGVFTTRQGFTVQLLRPPNLTVMPQDLTALSGSTVHFATTAEGSSPLTYIWQHDGAMLGSETNSVLTLNDISTNAAGLYRVIVANEVGSATSSLARLTVQSQPDSVNGHLYFDANGDGWQSAGDPHITNVTVFVTNSAGAYLTALTDMNGNWTAIVPPGTTTMRVNTSDTNFLAQVPAYFQQSEGEDPTTVAAVAGASSWAGNDGYSSQSVEGHVYRDSLMGGQVGRYNSLFDEPVTNALVVITDSQGMVTSVRTDAHGYFKVFLPPGQTTVRVDRTDAGFPSGLGLTSNTYGEGDNPSTLTLSVGESATCDTGFLRYSPTLASITSLTAAWHNGQAKVAWVAVAELGTVAYDLMREQADGSWVIVNAEPVFATGLLTGGTYEVADSGVLAGCAYRYQIIEYAENGMSVEHGPYVVVIGARPAQGDPAVTLQRVNAVLRLAWPPWAGGRYRLEQSDSPIGPHTWTEVPLPTAQATAVDILMNGPVGFFRLRAVE